MKGKTVSVNAPDGVFSAYLNQPPVSNGPKPAVIVLQEIFGVNRFIREACDWLAGNGFLALAPDLFWRQAPSIELDEGDRERAVQLMQGLDHDRAVEDCTVAILHLRGLPECNGKIGALGYCLGGKLAYLMATRGIADAAISYYGVGIQGALDEAPTLRKPLLLHIASQDALCPPAAQERIVAALHDRPNVSIRTYPVGHAFARTASDSYSPQSAESANQASLDFLTQML